jgi:hypothetical protein
MPHAWPIFEREIELQRRPSMPVSTIDGARCASKLSEAFNIVFMPCRRVNGFVTTRGQHGISLDKSTSQDISIFTYTG